MRSYFLLVWVSLLIPGSLHPLSLAGQAFRRSPGIAVELVPSFGFPVGAFAARDPGLGARIGAGVGVGASVGLTPRYGVFAGAQYMRFGCGACPDFGFDGSVVDMGVEAGLEARFAVALTRAWLRLGLAGHQLQLRDPAESAASKVGWGVLAATGADHAVWRNLSISPSVRFMTYRAVFPLATFEDQATSVLYAAPSVALKYGF